ncbi:hypothetical protein [Aquabacter cavernae]|uniref:hypothetical protein n=1 Tax=Aquabacter cavernae TaxID=2496029 RepID=UPI0013DF02F4|nr:hypothetical protein [Aquabacter cavernae]
MRMRGGVEWRVGVAILGGVMSLGAQAALAAPPPPKCVASAQYQVVYRDRADAVGMDILVQKLDGKPRKCAFDRKTGDYRIGDPDDPNYVLSLGGNVLVLDQGTGPDRTLGLYDVQAKKFLLTQDYDDGQPVDVKPTLVRFQAVTGPATAANCPDFKSMKENGLEPSLTQAAEVALPAGKMTLSGKVGCIARQ